LKVEAGVNRVPQSLISLAPVLASAIALQIVLA